MSSENCSNQQNSTEYSTIPVVEQPLLGEHGVVRPRLACLATHRQELGVEGGHLPKAYYHGTEASIAGRNKMLSQREMDEGGRRRRRAEALRTQFRSETLPSSARSRRVGASPSSGVHQAIQQKIPTRVTTHGNSFLPSVLPPFLPSFITCSGERVLHAAAGCTRAWKHTSSATQFPTPDTTRSWNNNSTKTRRSSEGLGAAAPSTRQPSNSNTRKPNRGGCRKDAWTTGTGGVAAGSRPRHVRGHQPQIHCLSLRRAKMLRNS